MSNKYSRDNNQFANQWELDVYDFFNRYTFHSKTCWNPWWFIGFYRPECLDLEAHLEKWALFGSETCENWVHDDLGGSNAKNSWWQSSIYTGVSGTESTHIKNKCYNYEDTYIWEKPSWGSLNRKITKNHKSQNCQNHFSPW